MTTIWCYVFILPAMILAGLFTFYPIVASWFISFLEWSGITADGEFVGLDNYREAVSDPFFWRAFGRSFLFTSIDVPIRLFLALVVAIILNDAALRMRSIFRTIFFLPVVTTMAVVGVVWSLLLSPFDGPVNIALLETGLVGTPIDFLGSVDTALISVVAVHIWKSFGITMIYWLVALQTVPAGLYEAARMDGAGRWRMHRDITMPLIKPFAILIALISVVSTLQVFGLVQAMTQGRPNYSTELVELYVYRLAFAPEGAVEPRMGYASAVAVIFGVAVMVIALGQGWALRRARSLRAAARTETGGEDQ
ncbi:carbohydrate ABC transporter permease [Phytoactinopolyspora endophytica]|uniref:carbohydrate ABC transporter permease n=1 Tax=Phytoactinopolyspora endophytica TaxID=1642495 RepID=UPI00197BD93F|nr:sugar ABC transporter permease [Phytoactinopolyspora endophytica]